jgi:RNA-binding protein
LLKPAQRKSLRKQAHHLKPTVFVGKDGMSDTVVAATKESILAHELIKVRFVDNKDNKKVLAAQVAKRSGSELVGVIGHLAILYREHPEEGKRKVKLTDYVKTTIFHRRDR